MLSTHTGQPWPPPSITPTTQHPALWVVLWLKWPFSQPHSALANSYSSCMDQVKGPFLQEAFSDGPSSHQAQASSINPAPLDFVVANPSLLFLLLSCAFLGTGTYLLISSFVCVCVCVCVYSVMSDSLILWTVAYQDPLSMEFYRQEYWNGLPFPSPGDLPNPGIEPTSPALAGRFFTSQPQGKPSCEEEAIIGGNPTGMV